jgi:anti-sigma factor RsiW
MMGGVTDMKRKDEHPSMETLAAFLDGSLDVYEREEILKHIADCDDCRCFVADWVKLESPASNGNY